VANTGDGVRIFIEGAGEAVSSFGDAIEEMKPPLAEIAAMEITAAQPQGLEAFVIEKSGGETAPANASNFTANDGASGPASGPASPPAPAAALIPPDIATCRDCLTETNDPEDRHFRYPFTNCTNCGPRFTITTALPYDRHQTAMASFPMCPDCAQEYHDPLDRRFHAQPVACPTCGPRVWLTDRGGTPLPGDQDQAPGGPVLAAARLLREGSILAIKGLGGFHLACDAANPGVVALLRRRKRRPHKPFALMARDSDVVAHYCHLSPAEAAQLTGARAPIVVLEARVDVSDEPIAPAVAPGMRSLGMMLPYTPLHQMLLAAGPRCLVMTSGNRSGLPLVTDNRHALSGLGGVADYFLLHDRDIPNRCDDSVLRVLKTGKPLFYRRSRGYVPGPIEVEAPADAPPAATVLGIGAEEKNTFTILAQGKAYCSQHLGSMGHQEGLTAFDGALNHLQSLLGQEPMVIGYDPHPDYIITRHYTSTKPNPKPQTGGDVFVPVQHHHAHMASCLAEHGRHREEAIGIILDGTGYGDDGNLWGFEVFTGSSSGYRRRLHLEYLPLPGGEGGIQNPLRTAVAALGARLGEGAVEWALERWPHHQEELEMAWRIAQKGINTPLASSGGRLFDIVSALTGICHRPTYDGHAAVLLSEAMSKQAAGSYPLSIIAGGGCTKIIGVGSLLAAVVADISKGVDPSVISRRFHDTLVGALLHAAVTVRQETGLNLVALSGGVFQNAYLACTLEVSLTDKGFTVLTHQRVPPNDGGVSLGQAVVALRRWEGRHHDNAEEVARYVTWDQGEER